MRLLFLACLVALAGCVPNPVRVEGFAAPDNGNFFYSAHTDAVMTENDDGVSERLRRDWLADALKAHSMCGAGYVVATRRYVPDADGPFANGGNIVYRGRCL